MTLRPMALAIKLASSRPPPPPCELPANPSRSLSTVSLHSLRTQLTAIAPQSSHSLYPYPS
jgi:hypothetical protein